MWHGEKLSFWGGGGASRQLSYYILWGLFGWPIILYYYHRWTLWVVNNYFKTLWVVHYLFAGLLGLSIISSVDPVESFFIGLLGWSMIMRTLRWFHYYKLQLHHRRPCQAIMYCGKIQRFAKRSIYEWQRRDQEFGKDVNMKKVEINDHEGIQTRRIVQRWRRSFFDEWRE